MGRGQPHGITLIFTLRLIIKIIGEDFTPTAAYFAARVGFMQDFAHSYAVLRINLHRLRHHAVGCRIRLIIPCACPAV